jgi:hypothetical protein
MFIISAILFSFTKKKKVIDETNTDKKNILPVNPNISVIQNSENLGTKENPIFPMKRGSKGSHVQELQRGLNHQYFYVRKLKKLQPLELDGIFGPSVQTMLQELYNVSQVDKELAKKMYKDNGIFIMPAWIDNLI